jgi:aspartate kinase
MLLSCRLAARTGPRARALSSSPSRALDPLPVVVQKFGGTSLGSTEKLDKVHEIVSRWHSDRRVVAVVSALSAERKEEGTTTRLLSAAEAAISGASYGHFLDAILETHHGVVDEALTGARRDEVRGAIDTEVHEVRRFLKSMSVIREMSPRSENFIIGAGERLAATTVAGFLSERGVPAVPVDLSCAFERLDASRQGYQREARDAIAARIREAWAAAAASSTGALTQAPPVPVVTGYFGHVAGGIVRAIGRGYTDLTSALAAAGLGAEALQVWKESDGVFTGNPTKIESARLLGYITPSEAAELTYFGNEVLHPFTMECAIQDDVPIHILNTFKPESPGTVVGAETGCGAAAARSLEKGVVAVTSRSDVTVVNLHSNRKLGSASFLARVFETFRRRDVKVDLITSSEVSVSASVHQSTSAETLASLQEDLSKLGDCRLLSGRAIVSVVGEEMRGRVGLAAELFDSLSRAGVNLEMICQGSSEIVMSVVVAKDDCDTAIAEVHRTFLEENAASRGAASARVAAA